MVNVTVAQIRAEEPEQVRVGETERAMCVTGHQRSCPTKLGQVGCRGNVVPDAQILRGYPFRSIPCTLTPGLAVVTQHQERVVSGCTDGACSGLDLVDLLVTRACLAHNLGNHDLPGVGVQGEHLIPGVQLLDRAYP